MCWSRPCCLCHYHCWCQPGGFELTFGSLKLGFRIVIWWLATKHIERDKDFVPSPKGFVSQAGKVVWRPTWERTEHEWGLSRSHFQADSGAPNKPLDSILLGEALSLRSSRAVSREAKGEIAANHTNGCLLKALLWKPSLRWLTTANQPNCPQAEVWAVAVSLFIDTELPLNTQL